MARAARSEEERGAADAIPGVAPPRETTTLVGQEAAERTLLDAYRSGRMHHGWIFAGERGIGKATLAFRLAGRSPLEVCEHMSERGIFVAGGDFYATTLADRLGINATGGFVRAGLAPYNTEEEVEAFLEALEELVS